MIVVCGLSHRTAPVDVREKLAGSDTPPEMVLVRLASREEIKEVVFVSTCNRVEIYASGRGNEHATLAAVREELANLANLPNVDSLQNHLYERSGSDAVRHIFRVASSLDSMVVGEPQILGQVKDAFEAATSAGTVGAFLGRCVTRAFSVAKRVRSETAIGSGQVSISSVAVDLAKRIFGELDDSTVLLVGAGDMAEAAARSLGNAARSLRVVNRSFERGAALAQTFGADVARWESLESELVHADIVVASTGAKNFVVTRDMAKRVMKARRGRSLFFVDIAVPRNVDPSIHSIDNVYVFNIDDLEEQVAEGMKMRHGEVDSAERIVQDELREFEAWSRGLSVQPTIVALRAKARAVMLGELERTLGGKLKHLGEVERAALQQMMDTAVNKLLHGPTTRLKTGADAPGAELVRAVTELFDLPEVSTPSLDERARDGRNDSRPSASPSDPEEADASSDGSRKPLPM
ncbi:MAG: glutamyl-tRNA reductase [Polyangiaceae bacterium]